MMKLLLRSLLLSSLCSLCSWGVSSVNEFPVTQTSDVTAMEGETVHIECCWNRSFQGGKVNWLKNAKEINKKSTVQTLFIKDYLCQTDQGNVACNCSMLTLPNIARNDSATYICKVNVELPDLCQSEGNGTRITVAAKHNTSTDVPIDSNTDEADERSQPLPVLISVAIVSPLLFITFIGLCCLWSRRGKAARVIYEVPHDRDSTEVQMADLGVDGNSTTSSRGSSHWCQVTLYESIDYFERVEDKASAVDEEQHSTVVDTDLTHSISH